MRFTIAALTLLAGFAVAMPAGNLNAQQDAADAKVSAGQKADKNVNDAANNGAGVCFPSHLFRMWRSLVAFACVKFTFLLTVVVV